MKVPFYPLQRESDDLRMRVQKRWQNISDSGLFFHGNQEQELLGKLGDFLGVPERHLALVGSGTDALLLSLLSLGVGEGDEVITSSVSAAATASAISATGAQLVYVDVDQNGLMDLGGISSALQRNTKAIVPVHLYGNRVDTNALRICLKEAGREDISVVEDGAQSFGSLLRGAPLDLASSFHAFSFYPTKNLGCWGDGGLVWGKDLDLMDRLRALAFYGQRERNFSTIARGINSRLDEWQAAVLLEKLPAVKSSLEKKFQFLQFYQKSFSNLPIGFLRAQDPCYPAWHLGICVLRDSSQRNALLKYLQDRGIEVLIHYPVPLPFQPGVKGIGEFPKAKIWCDSILSLPLSSYHSEEEIVWAAESVRKFFAD